MNRLAKEFALTVPTRSGLRTAYNPGASTGSGIRLAGSGIRLAGSGAILAGDRPAISGSGIRSAESIKAVQKVRSGIRTTYDPSLSTGSGKKKKTKAEKKRERDAKKAKKDAEKAAKRAQDILIADRELEARLQGLRAQRDPQAGKTEEEIRNEEFQKLIDDAKAEGLYQEPEDEGVNEMQQVVEDVAQDPEASEVVEAIASDPNAASEIMDMAEENGLVDEDLLNQQLEAADEQARREIQAEKKQREDEEAALGMASKKRPQKRKTRAKRTPKPKPRKERKISDALIRRLYESHAEDSGNENDDNIFYQQQLYSKWSDPKLRHGWKKQWAHRANKACDVYADYTFPTIAENVRGYNKCSEIITNNAADLRKKQRGMPGWKTFATKYLDKRHTFNVTKKQKDPLLRDWYTSLPQDKLPTLRKPIASAWMQHVKSVRQDQPGLSYKEALKAAKSTYKRS